MSTSIIIPTRIVRKQLTPVMAAATFPIGTCLGGLLTVTNAVRVSAGSGILLSLQVSSINAIVGPVDIILLADNITTSTVTSGSQFLLTNADAPLFSGLVRVQNIDFVPISTGAGTTVYEHTAPNLQLGFTALTGTSVYIAVVTRVENVFASANPIRINLNIQQS